MYVQISVSTTGTENLGSHWVQVADREETHRMLDDTIDMWEALPSTADEQEAEDPRGG